MIPETCVEIFGLSCIFWTFSNSCLGVADAFLSVLHVLLASRGL